MKLPKKIRSARGLYKYFERMENPYYNIVETPIDGRIWVIYQDDKWYRRWWVRFASRVFKKDGDMLIENAWRFGK